MPTPYIPTTEADRRAMLQVIGVPQVDDLFQDIPKQVLNPKLDLPPGLSEMEVSSLLHSLAGLNANTRDWPSFLGAGAYRHFIPSTVWSLAKRSEFLTAYTPYQPEISQGVLQGLYEFQSLLCLLTGMEAANSGMYDGATAMAEAVLMACRLTGRPKVVILESVSLRYRRVTETYFGPLGLEMVIAKQGSPVPDDTACVVVQSPNFFGYVEDLGGISKATHNAGALLIVSVDPIAMGMFKPPGAYDADIVVGEGQPLGVPLSLGGPYLGLFACKTAHLRQMPGRIVGKTVDVHGRTAYVLTLQTREQHIRRERATSNICTSESLVALAAAIYLSTMGKAGLQQAANLCYQKAHYAAERISKISGYDVPGAGTFFKEFVVQCPVAPKQVNSFLRKRQIIGGLDVSDIVPNGMLLCVTEMTTRSQIDALVDALAELGKER